MSFSIFKIDKFTKEFNSQKIKKCKTAPKQNLRDGQRKY